MKKSEYLALTEKDRMNRTLEGVAYFASVHTPNYAAAKRFNAPPAFKITLGLDKENVAKAESYGLKVKEANKDIPYPHVVLKRKVKEGKTPEQVKPQVVDSLQRPVPSKILIGNESKVICKFGTYWADNNGGAVHPILFKVQIRDLVKYEPKNGLVMDEGGFTVDEDDLDDGAPPFDTDTAKTAKFDDDDGFEAPKG